MAIAFRGATSGPASAAGSRSIALPVGTAVGDQALLVLSSAGTGEVWTFGAGWTELLQETYGTSKAGIAVRQVTSDDVASGFVTYSQAAAGSTAYALATYSGASGFGSIGAVTKRASSSNLITAAAVGLSAGQFAVVVRLEKSTSNPGPSVVSPATTVRAQHYSNAAAAPSVWIGDSATEGSRLFTDPVSSGNGLGVQVALLPASAPPAGATVSLWNGTSEITGCSLSIWDGSTEIPISPSGLTFAP